MLSFRQALIFTFFTLCILIVFFSTGTDIQPSSYLPLGSKTSQQYDMPPELSDMEKSCQTHHGVLYKDVEETEKYWRKVGGMTRDDLEQSRWICERDGNCVSLKIYEGEVYIRHPIVHELGFQSRTHSMLLMLNRADLSAHPDTDFLFNSNDGVRLFEPCFLEMDKHYNETVSQSRNESLNHFLFPDFTSYDWYETRLPSFNEARLTLADSVAPFVDKIPKMFWKGAIVLQQGTQRSDLVKQLAPMTDIADISTITSKDFKYGKGSKTSLKTLSEMCAYQYLIYAEGIAYSGRLKYTSLCNSIQIGPKITYHEFWTHLLLPYYVDVEDWDDAVSKFGQLQNDPERAKTLAKGPVEMLKKHLSPTGLSCYIQRVLRGYKRSTNWEVLGPREDISGWNWNQTIVSNFTWIPLEHFLTRTMYEGTVLSSNNKTEPIDWLW